MPCPVAFNTRPHESICDANVTLNDLGTIQLSEDKNPLKNPIYFFPIIIMLAIGAAIGAALVIGGIS